MGPRETSEATRASRRRSGGPLRAFGRARHGGVAVATGISITVLIGAAALAIDLGQAYNTSTHLDNAADAYAIAGATQLDKTSNSCVRAIRAAVHANLRNEQNFASNASGPDITIDSTETLANANIRFLSDLVKDANGRITGTYITADLADCDAQAVYIEVTIDQDAAGDPYKVEFSFAPILGITEAFPKGYAVAGLGEVYCGVEPMMICELPVLPGAAAGHSFWDDLNARTDEYRGRGIFMKSGDSSAQWGPGEFGFVAGGSGGDINVLREAMGAVNPPFVCLALNNLETEEGNNVGARQGFNTRFDIYMAPLGGERGNPQWQPAANTVKGKMLDAGVNCALANWDDPSAPGTQVYDGPDTYGDPPAPVPGDAMPFPMDGCAYGAGSCNATAADNSDRMDDTIPPSWPLADYLAVNHPSDAPTEAALRADPSFLANHPDPATGFISRFDVYNWELGYPGNDWGAMGPEPPHLVDNISGGAFPPYPSPLGLGADVPRPQSAEYGGPQCYWGPIGDDVTTGTELKSDRRVIKVAVVDCDTNPVGDGTTDVEAEGFVEMFAVSTWQIDAGGVHQIYTEIIGPIEQGIDVEIAKVVVQLYE